MEGTFVDSSVETIFAKSSEHLSDMFAVEFLVVGVDEDIIEINYYANIEHVGEDVVHESLKSGWRIGEPERHDLPFEQSVAGSECSLPLITFSNVDQMISMLEVDFGVNSCSSWTI